MFTQQVCLITLVVIPALAITSVTIHGNSLALGINPESPIPNLKSNHNKATADKLLQRGNQQSQAGELVAAVKSWQEARRIYQQLQAQPETAQVLLKLGTAYVMLERYSDAISSLESLLSLPTPVDASSKAEALGNLGIAYRAVGNYGKAVELHRQAGRILHQVGDRAGLGIVLLNLGNTFATLGDYDSAIAAYQQSLKISQQITDKDGESKILANLGKVYADIGKYAEAISAHEQSLAIAQSLNQKSAQASALINLGSTYHAQKQSNRASSFYQQALQLAQAAGNQKLKAEALGSLALSFEDMRNFPKAIEYHQQALTIFQKLGDRAAEGMALNNLGHTLFGAGKLKEAESQLRAAVKVLDNLRPGLSDTYKVSIFDTQVYTYNLLQQILIAANQPEAALEAAEQGRARAFAELLAGRIAKDTNFVPNIDQIRQIARQQNATIVEYAFVPDDDFKFRGKQRGREEALYIWVVSPSGKVSFKQVDLKPLWSKGATFTEVVRISRCLILDDTADCGDLLEPIRELKASRTQASTPRQDYSQILHQYLIAPIADLLPTDPKAHVIFIPQESLFLTPFPALQDEQGKYLIEKHTIRTAPSIQVLELTRNLQQQNRQVRGWGNSSLFSSPDTALIVGNPVMPKIHMVAGEPPQPLQQLPQAQQEAKDVAKLFRSQAITGAAATKAQVLEKLPKARVVHLATHGLLEYTSEKTEVSLRGLGIPGAIALAPSGNDDGFLTASEILNLRLNTELVVLSACKSGQGRISGDGVIGLSRAWISAGTPSIIVSLWSVQDDQTALLMTNFYQKLQQHPDKAAALREAMLETMKTHPEPLYWAAFTLIGEAE